MIKKTQIRRYVQRLVDRFDPDRVYLFGSYANGQPTADSDVDLLVIMPARNQLDQAAKIRQAIPADFPLDLVVRKPSEWAWRIEEGESFCTTIATQGKLLHEKRNEGMGTKSRNGFSVGEGTTRKPKALSGSNLLSLPASGRKISQGRVGRKRLVRSENA